MRKVPGWRYPWHIALYLDQDLSNDLVTRVLAHYRGTYQPVPDRCHLRTKRLSVACQLEFDDFRVDHRHPESHSCVSSNRSPFTRLRTSQNVRFITCRASFHTVLFRGVDRSESRQLRPCHRRRLFWDAFASAATIILQPVGMRPRLKLLAVLPPIVMAGRSASGGSHAARHDREPPPRNCRSILPRL
jgi:hypothetical protein